MTALTGRRQAPGRAPRGRCGVLRERGALRKRHPSVSRDPQRPRAQQRGARVSTPRGASLWVRSWRACSRRPSSSGSARRGSPPSGSSASQARSCSSASPRARAVLAAGSYSSRVASTRSPTSVRTRTGCGCSAPYGRSIVNSFHGIWSIGTIYGGLMGAATIPVGVSLEGRARRGIALLRGRRARELPLPPSEDRTTPSSAQRPRSKVSRWTLRPRSPHSVCSPRVARSSKTPARHGARFT